MRRAASLALTGALVLVTLTGSFIVPTGLTAGRLLLQPDDAAAITAWRLSGLTPPQYAAALSGAIDQEDADLAASLLALADAQHVALPADLRTQALNLQDFDAGRLARDIWAGISQGDATSEAGLGGALAADLTGIGDLRDLAKEGTAYVAGQPYDGVVLVLAAAGLAVTAATVLTAGGAAPARTGMTILKTAKKAGDLPAPLVAELVTISRRAVDDEALRATLESAKRLDLPGAAQTAGRLLKPAELAKLTRAAGDVADIGTTAGYRAVRQSVKVADSTADLAKLQRLARTFGPRFRAVLALLGAGVLSLAGLLVTLAGWTITLLLWAGAAATLILRGLLFVVGRLRRRRWGA